MNTLTTIIMKEANPVSYQSISRLMTAKKTILVADDDTNDAFLLEHAFERASINATLHFVHDGAEAVRYLESEDQQQHPTPDLVLLDLKMPRMDGFEVLQWVRAQPRLRRLPVTVLTSSDARVDINRAYDLGANSYLVKPLSNDQLLKMVEALQRYWFSVNLAPECDPLHYARVTA